MISLPLDAAGNIDPYRFPVWITNLHNSIRDDHYSGSGLQNFGEAALECGKEIG
ncbi:hypothetical protein MKW92_009877, partial [Papaver armeniacum]